MHGVCGAARRTLAASCRRLPSSRWLSAIAFLASFTSRRSASAEASIAFFSAERAATIPSDASSLLMAGR